MTTWGSLPAEERGALAPATIEKSCDPESGRPNDRIGGAVPMQSGLDPAEAPGRTCLQRGRNTYRALHQAVMEQSWCTHLHPEEAAQAKSGR